MPNANASALDSPPGVFAPGSPVFELRGVDKVYPHPVEPVRVLSGVNLTLAADEFVFVTGASGSGKSTLLHLLGLLDRPTAGTISYRSGDGTPWYFDALSPREAARLRNREFGFVFQQYHLLPDFTVLENVTMPARLRAESSKKDEIRARALGLLDEVGLSRRLDHVPGQLSGGERQRVAIARALFNNPRFLLCDEPTGNLDARRALEILRLLETVQASGTAVLLVTHNEELVGACERPHRRLFLRLGRLHHESGDAPPARG